MEAHENTKIKSDHNWIGCKETKNKQHKQTKYTNRLQIDVNNKHEKPKNRCKEHDNRHVKWLQRVEISLQNNNKEVSNDCDKVTKQHQKEVKLPQRMTKKSKTDAKDKKDAKQAQRDSNMENKT